LEDQNPASQICGGSKKGKKYSIMKKDREKEERKETTK